MSLSDFFSMARDLRAPNPAVRARTAAALGRSGEPRALPLLIEAVHDPDAKVRASAARALGRLGHSDGAVPLAGLLRDADPEVMTAAASALGVLGAESVAPRVAAAFETVAESLPVDEEEAPGELEERLTALGVALAGLGAPGAEALGAMLLHPAPAARRIAAESLSRSGSPGVAYLCARLKRSLEEERVGELLDSRARPAVARTLGLCARTRPVPELRQAVPLLRRCAAHWRGEGMQAVRLYRETLRLIEAVTEQMGALPLPSGAPPPDPASLPTPASGPAPDAASLPLAAPPPGAPPPAGPPAAGEGFFRRLLRLLAGVLLRR